LSGRELGLALRRGEVLGLQWRDVELANPGRPTAAARSRDVVRNGTDTLKFKASKRTLALSSFSTGRPMDVQRYAETLNKALTKGRGGGTGSTIPRRQGTRLSPTMPCLEAPRLALQNRAGHSSFSITQRYIDLAGKEFHEESERHQERIFWCGADCPRQHERRRIGSNSR
jgi:integrase